ncbi:Chromo domain/shadow [Plasmopara halstedii]|uniref:Chromo domain/shadow n=1 Tax=Plasmopara halstedii TaxID=4781 RepID=A0A0P1AEV9_PLAHL|nr:Chromo domain/shadow [Plasmopara halstedii]CEG39433.1 Chromo domain/shadow [Plasmopara halstedii]|eukprot:XP_024575802.1 Chromo domain/shadow [Plasmopara halstedii]
MTERTNVVSRVLVLMAKAQNFQNSDADTHERENTDVLKDGDYVRVSTKNMADAAASSLDLPSFFPIHWSLRGLEMCWQCIYIGLTKLDPKFSVGLLRLYLSKSTYLISSLSIFDDPSLRSRSHLHSRMQRRRSDTSFRPVAANRDGVAHSHVEKIVWTRLHRGSLQLLMKWLEYPESDSS